MRLSRWSGPILMALLAAAVVLVSAQDAPGPTEQTATVESGADQEEPLYFVARETWPQGREVGLVTLGPWEVIRITSELGGLSPYERAMIAAKRLNDYIEDYGPEEPIRQITIQGYEVVQGGAINVITVDDATARTAGMTCAQLADRWCTSLREAIRLGGHRVAPGPPRAEAAPAGGYQPLPSLARTDGASATTPIRPPAVVTEPTVSPTEDVTAEPATSPQDPDANYAESTVPLIDAHGATLGRAVVGGPATGVGRVTRVVQLAEQVGAAQLRALAPCADTPRGEPLSRVPDVYIVGIASGAEAAEGG